MPEMASRSCGVEAGWSGWRGPGSEGDETMNRRAGQLVSWSAEPAKEVGEGTPIP